MNLLKTDVDREMISAAHGNRPSSGGAPRPSFAAAPGWSVEGGADFVEMDLVRRFLNVGDGTNWKWSDNLDPSKAGVIFALEPFEARGRLTWGYYDASSLLQVAGGSFYVRIRGAPGQSVLSAVSSTPEARWMIARVRQANPPRRGRDGR